MQNYDPLIRVGQLVEALMEYDLNAPIRLKYHKKDGTDSIPLQIGIVSVDDDGENAQVFFECEDAVEDSVLFAEAERIRAGGELDGNYASLAEMRVAAEVTAMLMEEQEQGDCG